MKSNQLFFFVSVLHKCLNKVIALEDISAQGGLKAVTPAIIRVQKEGVCISSLFQSGMLVHYERQAPAVLSDVVQCVFFPCFFPGK